MIRKCTRNEDERTLSEIRTMRSPNALPAPTPTPLLSRLTPPRPPGTPASSIILICLCGVLYFTLRSLICRLYLASNTGLKLQSCLILPVRIVVRARVFTVAAAALVDTLSEGSLGRSATTIWFSTASFTMSSSYASGSDPEVANVVKCSNGGREALGWGEGWDWGEGVLMGLEGSWFGGRKSTMRGFLPVRPGALL
jgi:hypothetical protein